MPDGASRFGPDHHILVEVLDKEGQRKMGVPVRFYWGDGHTDVPTNKVGGSYAADYGMTSAGHGFGVFVETDAKSDLVFGMGLGKLGNEHMGDHVTYYLVFQEVFPSAQSELPTQPPAPASVPALAHPVADPRGRMVTQRFGERPDYYARFSVDGVPLRGHNGIDFGTPEGTWITAVDSGNVVEVADDTDGYGRYVKLVHPWGESLYAHLSAWAVAVGDKVERGQWIGDSGNTGNSTGPHLHFGMRVNPYNRQDGWGGFVDPAPYLINVSAPDAPTTRHAIVKAICAAALEFGVDSDLLLSLAWAESSFLLRAESSQGAKGLFQIMPATWAEWGPKVGATDPFVARDSARVGAAYFAWLLKTLNGDVYDAIVAYNAGIGNVLNDGAIGPETYQYADKVIHGRDLLKAVGQ